MTRLDRGDLVACAGDSITEHLVAVSDAAETQVNELPAVGSSVRIDRHERRGWVAMLAAQVTVAFPDLELRFLNAGRGGDTSRLLRERLEEDVMAHAPRLCLLAIGVNDVRRNFQPERAGEVVAVDEFRTNLQAMTERLQRADAQVVFIEPTPYVARPTGAPNTVAVGDVNAKTRAYADVMRRVATECSALFIPVFQPMFDLQERLQKRMPQQTLFEDEVHLGALGDLHYCRLVFESVFTARPA